MSGTDGKVRIGVEVDSNEAKKELSELGKKGSSIVSKLGDVAKKTAIAMGTSAAAIGGFALKVGTSFQSTMSEVQAVSGATADQMQLLSDKAKEMGQKTAFSATQAGEAFSYMAMAGWKTEDMLSGIEGIMNLAAAAGEDLAMTSDIVTDALTAFGMSAAESGKFADILAAASSNANTNVAMLGESFKYVAPVAGSLGYSAADTSIALGLMASAGIKAGQAGTALRAALTRMVKPTSDAASMMDAYGISLTKSDGTMKTMGEVMDDLRTSMGGLSEAEKSQAAAVIFGQEAMSGMLAIINASEDDYKKLTDAIYESEGAAKKMAEIRLDNLAGQMELLKSAAEGFGLVVFESISGPLTNLVTAGKDAIAELTDVLENQGAAAMLSAAAGMLSNLIAGIQAQAPLVVNSGADALASFISGIGSQLPQLIPQALSLVVTLADAIISNAPKIVDAGIDLLTGLVKGIINSLPILITEGPRIVNDFADAVYSGVGKLLATGAKLVIELAKGLISNIPLIIRNGGQILLALINAFSLSKMLSLGKSLITNLGSGIKSMMGDLAGNARNVASNAMTVIKNLDWKAIGRHAIQNIVSGLKAVAGLIKDALVSAAKNAFTAVKSIDVKSIGVNIIKGIVNGVKSMAANLASAALGVVKSAVSGIKSFLGIHSPSKLMEKLIGHNMIAGVEVGFEADADSLEKTAVGTMQDVADAMSKVDYLRRLKSLRLPDISGYTGLYRTDKTGRQNNPETVSGGKGIDPEGVKRAVKEGLKEGLKGVKFEMDGRETGKIIAPYIDEYMPEPAW